MHKTHHDFRVRRHWPVHTASGAQSNRGQRSGFLVVRRVKPQRYNGAGWVFRKEQRPQPWGCGRSAELSRLDLTHRLNDHILRERTHPQPTATAPLHHAGHQHSSQHDLGAVGQGHAQSLGVQTRSTLSSVPCCWLRVTERQRGFLAAHVVAKPQMGQRNPSEEWMLLKAHFGQTEPPRRTEGRPEGQAFCLQNDRIRKGFRVPSTELK